MQKIILIIADLTALAANAIVNPANASMLKGGGLCGIIHSKAGEAFAQECVQLHKENAQYPVSSTKLTTAGKLPAQFVIHAVSPKWVTVKGDKFEALAATYRNILQEAHTANARIISMPSIATGVNGYPQPDSAIVAIKTLTAELPKHPNVKSLFIVCHNQRDANAYREAIAQVSTDSVQILNLIPEAV